MKKSKEILNRFCEIYKNNKKNEIEILRIRKNLDLILIDEIKEKIFLAEM